MGLPKTVGHPIREANGRAGRYNMAAVWGTGEDAKKHTRKPCRVRASSSPSAYTGAVLALPTSRRLRLHGDNGVLRVRKVAAVRHDSGNDSETTVAGRVAAASHPHLHRRRAA